MRRNAGGTAVVATLLAVMAATPAEATFPGADGAVAFSRSGHVWTATFGPTYSEKRLTTSGVNRNPRWSPDGNRIAFNTKGGDIKVMSAGGTNVRTVVMGGYQPAWSPVMATGQVLAFVRVPSSGLGDIWTVPLAGGAATRITTDGGANCGNSYPSFSPDGALLLYHRKAKGADGTCADPTRPPQIVVLNLATKSRRVVPVLEEDSHSFPPSARADFTADGEAVQYLGISDMAMIDMVIEYDLATRTQRPLDHNARAEGGDHRYESVPTPSGGVATAQTTVGGGACITVPTGGKCAAGHGWSQIDVRPRPM